jgi:Cu(I)/Ag(I) efflux system membrane fusion protein
MTKKTTIVLLILAGMVVFGYFIYIKVVDKPNQTENSGTKNINSNIDYYHCGMHPQIVSNKPGKCPICGMDLTPVYKSSTPQSDGIVSIDPTMVQDIGVKTEVVTKRTLTHTIRTTGRTDYEETSQSVITTKFSGWIEKLYVNYTGKPVLKGQPLFEIYSPELVAAQQEYLQAIRYNKTMKTTSDSSVSQGAGELLQSAKKKLQYWDISLAQIQELERTENIKKTLIIYSPFSGDVIEKYVFEGMQVQAGANLFKLADISKMWIYADVYENELSWIKIGDPANIELPGTPGVTLKGKVAYIYPFMQDQTRSGKVRIEYSDNSQSLKKDMYVTIHIIPTLSINAIAVPEQSVIHSGSRDIVVMAMGKGKFMSMEVKLGVLADGYYEVKAGLNEGDTIVTSSQFLIDSESNLKAGASSMQGMNMEGMENTRNGKPKDDMKSMKNMSLQKTDSVKK